MRIPAREHSHLGNLGLPKKTFVFTVLIVFCTVSLGHQKVCKHTTYSYIAEKF